MPANNLSAFGVFVVETVTRKLELFVANEGNALLLMPEPPALSFINSRGPRQLPEPGSVSTLPPDGRSSQADPSSSPSRLLGSDGLLLSTAWASSWVAKEEQLRSVCALALSA